MMILGDSNSVFIRLDGFDNISDPGIRAEDVLERLRRLELEKANNNTLIIGVGVNDSATITKVGSKGKIGPDIEGFKNTYSEILDLAKDTFKQVICIGLISSTEEEVLLGSSKIQYKNSEIARFNKVIKILCEEAGVEFIDLLPYFLGREKKLLSDHIHPNDEGRRVILGEVLSKLN